MLGLVREPNPARTAFRFACLQKYSRTVFTTELRHPLRLSRIRLLATIYSYSKSSSPSCPYNQSSLSLLFFLLVHSKLPYRTTTAMLLCCQKTFARRPRHRRDRVQLESSNHHALPPIPFHNSGLHDTSLLAHIMYMSPASKLYDLTTTPPSVSAISPPVIGRQETLLEPRHKSIAAAATARTRLKPTTSLRPPSPALPSPLAKNQRYKIFSPFWPMVLGHTFPLHSCPSNTAASRGTRHMLPPTRLLLLLRTLEHQPVGGMS